MLKTKIKKILQNIVRWIKAHRKLSLIIGGIILVIITSLTAYIVYVQSKPPAPEPVKIIKKAKKKPAPVYYSNLTGQKVATEPEVNQAVTAIMIENSPDARPQSGLKSAGVVYEAIAEGGITRFLALYQNDKPQLIGPVRSLRMYYVDWLAPYEASVAHVGGSAAALSEIRNGSYRDIDQFFNAGSYWRASDRWAPHNVYTNFEKLDALNQAKNYMTSEFVGFTRSDSKPVAALDATSVTINMSSPQYNTTYQFDSKANAYNRSLGGAPHVDREAGQITPNVVVAMKVNMHKVFEDGWRESIQTIGSGEATVFQNGKAHTVTWRKNDRKSPLEFLDASGKPFALNRGQTWISAVPNGTGGVSWE